MTDDRQQDTRTTRMDVDVDDPTVEATRSGDITGYEGSDEVVGRPEGSDLGGTERAAMSGPDMARPETGSSSMGRPDMERPDEMPKEGVSEASPSVPNDALAEPRH